MTQAGPGASARACSPAVQRWQGGDGAWGRTRQCRDGAGAQRRLQSGCVALSQKLRSTKFCHGAGRQRAAGCMNHEGRVSWGARQGPALVALAAGGRANPEAFVWIRFLKCVCWAAAVVHIRFVAVVERCGLRVVSRPCWHRRTMHMGCRVMALAPGRRGRGPGNRSRKPIPLKELHHVQVASTCVRGLEEVRWHHRPPGPACRIGSLLRHQVLVALLGSTFWFCTKGRFTPAAGRRAAGALQQCNWLLFVLSFHTRAAGREHADEKSADVACRWQ